MVSNSIFSPPTSDPLLHYIARTLVLWCREVNVDWPGPETLREQSQRVEQRMADLQRQGMPWPQAAQVALTEVMTWWLPLVTNLDRTWDPAALENEILAWNDPTNPATAQDVGPILVEGWPEEDLDDE